MQTVEEILDVLLACEAAVGEYNPPYGKTLRGKIAEARASLLFWVAKDRIAGAREQWKAKQQVRGVRASQAKNGGYEGEETQARILQIFPSPSPIGELSSSHENLSR